MSLELLKSAISAASESSYGWSLYFFKIDRRKENPYLVYKIKFKKDSYLSDYASKLCEMVKKFQIEQLEDIQKYDGVNSKLSCDKLDTDSDLIEEQWNYFSQSVGDATDAKLSGKYQGYILVGQPQKKDKKNQPIVFVKAGNPVAQLKNDKSIIFTCSPENELEDITTEEIYRLYFSADFIVIGKTLYTFTYKFENIFNIEKTMQKMKMTSIENIVDTGAFSDSAITQQLMKSYKSSRTFLSLNQNRMSRLSNPESRVAIAGLLKLTIDSSGAIKVDTEDQAKLMIKYLCYKILQDKETDNVIEVNSVINDNVKIGA